MAQTQGTKELGTCQTEWVFYQMKQKQINNRKMMKGDPTYVELLSPERPKTKKFNDTMKENFSHFFPEVVVNIDSVPSVIESY